MPPVVGESPLLPDVKHIIAVASGKGGVGKSTAAVNLALALAETSGRVGLLDADVYGPSVPGMLGITDHPRTLPNGRLATLEKYGLAVMSMGLLASRETPVIWRGPMATKLIQQFFGAVEWGPLDWLVLDLPPGTGDVQLTITQTVPLAGAVIISTPQDVALQIALKGLRMFQDVRVPVLGLVENMSAFHCPHCHERTEIFGHGGARRACEARGIPFLGEVPLDPGIVAAGDAGDPIVRREPKGASAEAYRHVARRMREELDRVNGAVAAVKIHPRRIGEGETAGHLGIEWEDGQSHEIAYRTLRLACPCAACVDEWTREKRLNPATVPEDVRPREVAPIGRYALHFDWSDGHSSGIYTLDRLRAMAEEQGRPIAALKSTGTPNPQRPASFSV